MEKLIELCNFFLLKDSLKYSFANKYTPNLPNDIITYYTDIPTKFSHSKNSNQHENVLKLPLPKLNPLINSNWNVK